MTTFPAQLGPFTIEREIGRGGMGVVYLGHDTKLDRAVAIKALPEHLAQDPERLARFEREAKTLAQLSHSNVAGIHGVEEQDGNRYLVLEYVEGETLAERLDRGALPVDEALEMCGQIAAGVEAAHEAGVIHRDLKPANIKIDPDGRVKVLDFGLAKVEEGASSTGSGMSQSPTLTSPAIQHSPTISGAIMGTAAYMSPEQARGRKIDKRTDIWSFGVVLYECLAGTSPFVGETVSDSIGAILHKEVDLDRLPPETPSAVRHVLERCLRRSKDERWRDIGDVRVELDSTDRESDAQALGPGRGSTLPVVLGVALIAAVAWGAWLTAMSPGPTPARPLRVVLTPPEGARIIFSGDLAGPPVVSPDGTKIAFCAVRPGEARRLWLRDLGEPESRELDGTDGALFPFWRPDGREIAFFTPDSLRRIDLVSGTTQRVCQASQGRGGAWTDDGRIIFAPTFRGGLVIVDESGGELMPLTEIDGERHTSHRWPFFIGGTGKYLFSAVSARAGELKHNAIFLGDLGSESAPGRLIASNFRAEYVDGWLLHVRDDVLLASRVDLDASEVGANPIVLARNVDSDLSTWHGQFSASAAGVLAYSAYSGSRGETGPRSAYSWQVEGDRVTGYGSDGREQVSYATEMHMRTMALSPDGTMLAMDVVSPDGFLDIWLHPTAFVYDPDMEADEGSPRYRSSVVEPESQRLTFLEGPEVEPVWSPDGKQVAFRWAGDDEHPRGIYRKRIGGGSEQLVHNNEGGDDFPWDWTPDGKHLITVSGTLLPTESNDIWALPLDGGPKVLLVGDAGADIQPVISPDGRWLAYAKNSGRSDIYVIPFAPAWEEKQENRRWLISEDGGWMPCWSKEGDELYYVTDSGVLMALTVDLAGDTFVYSTPRALFQSPWDIGRSYDVTPKRIDGEAHFLFVNSAEGQDAPISLIVNWPELLEQSEP